MGAEEHALMHSLRKHVEQLAGEIGDVTFSVPKRSGRPPRIYRAPVGTAGLYGGAARL